MDIPEQLVAILAALAIAMFLPSFYAAVAEILQDFERKEE